MAAIVFAGRADAPKRSGRKPDKLKDCRSKQWPVSRNIGPIVDVVRYLLGSLHLEHVAKKLRDFFDRNMLQLFKFERFLFDQMIPSDREAL